MKQKNANLLLLLVTFLWSTTYISTKIITNELPVLNVIALRFIIGFIVTGLIFFKRVKSCNKETFKYSLLFGTMLFIMFTFNIFGLKYTSTSNAGFLGSTKVVFIPILSTLIFKQKPKNKMIVGVVFAIIGMGLLSLQDNLKVNFGDFLVLISAILYTFYIVLLNIHGKKVDTLVLGILQLGVVAALSTISTFVFENPSLPATPQSWFIIIMLSVFCTGLTFVLQTIAQPHTTPTDAGLIFTLEPIFNGLIAYIFANEVLTPKQYLGVFLILTGTLISQIDLSKFKIKFGKNTV